MACSIPTVLVRPRLVLTPSYLITYANASLSQQKLLPPKHKNLGALHLPLLREQARKQLVLQVHSKNLLKEADLLGG